MSSLLAEAPRLSARSLAAGYPGRRVIDGLDLDLAPGRLTMIIGASERCERSPNGPAMRNDPRSRFGLVWEKRFVARAGKWR